MEFTVLTLVELEKTTNLRHIKTREFAVCIVVELENSRKIAVVILVELEKI